MRCLSVSALCLFMFCCRLAAMESPLEGAVSTNRPAIPTGTSSPLFLEGEVWDWRALYSRLRYNEEAIYRFLWEKIDAGTKQLWFEYESTHLRRDELHQKLLMSLNSIVQGPSLWSPGRLQPKRLSLSTQRELARPVTNAAYSAIANRMLLEDLLPEVHRRLTLPRTLQDAAHEIIAGMDEDTKAEIRAQAKKDLVLYHHGWGTAIRNAYRLWRENRELLASCGTDDADVASMQIIESVWERLQETTLPSSAEPDGPANGSQPIRSETNTTSSAAGSRR